MATLSIFHAIWIIYICHTMTIIKRKVSYTLYTFWQHNIHQALTTGKGRSLNIL